MGKLGPIASEFLKLKRTWILWLHVLMPVAGIVLFLWYYSFSEWEAWGKVSGYMQVLAVVCPSLAGIVCALAADQEKQAGHMQNLLGLTKSRAGNLCRKLGVLLAANLLALFAAVAGFGAGFQLLIESLDVPASFYVIMTVLIWVPQICSYCFHLFLGLRFSKGVTIGAGIIESLLSALLLTGLGDEIWQYIPCAWGSRFASYYVLAAKNADAGSSLITGETAGVVSMIVVTVMGAALLFLWMSRYEGQTVED